MRSLKYSLDRLIDGFRQHRVLTLPQMMEALGTDVKMTVFRKLKGVDYRSSYSHAGKYYTLAETARWDADGLWVHQGIRFSRHGTLLETLGHFIDSGPSGWLASELEDRVGVRVHNALSELHRRGQVSRQQIGGAFVYVSCSGGDRQLARRQTQAKKASGANRRDEFDGPEVAESLRVFLSTLNEKQRRIYAGFESLKLGRGGDTKIARITGLNVKTVARGRKELAAGNIHADRIRAPGAGRPSFKKNRGAQATGTAP